MVCAHDRQALPPDPLGRERLAPSRVAHAPGRALPPRIPSGARRGGRLHRAVHHAAPRHRGHAAAHPPLRLRRGDPVLGHPHGAVGHGPGAALRGGRGPPARAGARRGRSGRAGRGGRGGAGRADLRDGARCPRGPRRPSRHGADRLRGKPLDRRLLHGRGAGRGRVRRGAPRRLPRPGLLRRGDGEARGGDAGLSARPGGRGGGGADALRFLGRAALAAGLPALGDRTLGAAGHGAARRAPGHSAHRLSAPRGPAAG